MIKSGHGRPPERVDVYLEMRDTTEGVAIDICNRDGFKKATLCMIDHRGIHLLSAIGKDCQIKTDAEGQIMVHRG